MAFSPLAGFVASIKVSTTGYAFDKWVFHQKNNLADVTTFLAAGARTLIPGCYEGTVSLSGPYDMGNQTVFAPGAALVLIVGMTTGSEVTVNGFVGESNQTADVKDAQRLEITFEASGPFILGPL